MLANILDCKNVTCYFFDGRDVLTQEDTNSVYWLFVLKRTTKARRIDRFRMILFVKWW